jgi:hypothetical protein
MIKRLLKLAVSALGFAYVLYYATTKLEWHFIDNVNLVFHESGHVIFLPLGDPLSIAGGSLLQVMVPLIFVFYFLLKKNYFAVSLMGYWAAINLINVSVYAGDALNMKLPLLGGDLDSHDWNQLLYYFGQLRNTESISSAIFITGIVVAASSLLISILLWRGTLAEETEGVYVIE